MMLFLGQSSGRMFGIVGNARKALAEGKPVMFVFKDVNEGLQLLRPHFPNALLEIDRNGIKIWDR